MKEWGMAMFSLLLGALCALLFIKFYSDWYFYRKRLEVEDRLTKSLEMSRSSLYDRRRLHKEFINDKEYGANHHSRGGDIN